MFVTVLVDWYRNTKRRHIMKVTNDWLWKSISRTCWICTYAISKYSVLWLLMALMKKSAVQCIAESDKQKLYESALKAVENLIPCKLLSSVPWNTSNEFSKCFENPNHYLHIRKHKTTNLSCFAFAYMKTLNVIFQQFCMETVNMYHAERKWCAEKNSRFHFFPWQQWNELEKLLKFVAVWVWKQMSEYFIGWIFLLLFWQKVFMSQ